MRRRRLMLYLSHSQNCRFRVRARCRSRGSHRGRRCPSLRRRRITPRQRVPLHPRSQAAQMTQSSTGVPSRRRSGTARRTRRWETLRCSAIRTNRRMRCTYSASRHPASIKLRGRGLHRVQHRLPSHSSRTWGGPSCRRLSHVRVSSRRRLPHGPRERIQERYPRMKPYTAHRARTWRRRTAGRSLLSERRHRLQYTRACRPWATRRRLLRRGHRYARLAGGLCRRQRGLYHRLLPGRTTHLLRCRRPERQVSCRVRRPSAAVAQVRDSQRRRRAIHGSSVHETRRTTP